MISIPGTLQLFGAVALQGVVPTVLCGPWDPGPKSNGAEGGVGYPGVRRNEPPRSMVAERPVMAGWTWTFM